MSAPTVVLVPGLRGSVEDHWQTTAGRDGCPPRGPCRRSAARTRACRPAITLLDRIVEDVEGPVILVAHSAGVLVTVHWAATYRGSKVVGALLATPPALAEELPPAYPSIVSCATTGAADPRRPLPFPSILAASSNDPLGNPVRCGRHGPGVGEPLALAGCGRPPQPGVRFRRLARGRAP